ncbi:hypothetical protein BCR34DRAFT_621934 [Clohesyomyces aquaticus]|uniref:Uncharacterized protein n=1 Tax=Clohesyomyces aquaticus TaxID=1231657 RepID=A0A1Y2A4V8_9PLEO|nr:hypothetical protein BCR34DRAFT_621934 [Clohesyomyces aquaticus]
MARQSSASSHVSQSPSDSQHLRAAPHKGQRQHVVGQSRMQRNASTGKNLNKLSKLTQTQAADGSSSSSTTTTTTTTTAKHHRRSHSGNSTSAPSSPRPSFKRNASSGAINHSSGHLSRHNSSKNMLKSSKSEIAPPKRSLTHPGKTRQHSPDAHPTVHFDIGSEEGADDGWTEESASQSPTTTRSNTRSNSVVLDANKGMHALTPDPETSQGEPSQSESNGAPLRPLPNAINHILPDRTLNHRPLNGSGTHHHSRPPDADMITSRLLQRSSSHNPPPQMSSIAATVVSDAREPKVLGQSAGSTLVDTPGRDLVSRFMDGDGSAGTPKDSSFLPSRNSPQSVGDFDKAKRNKSMPNVAGTATPSKAHSRRSGTSTPTDLPTSRTQQKLLLQRASSNIEPQKLVPAILPRTKGPHFIPPGITYSANGEGRLDPRLQQRFNQVDIEYTVVRRYRNPLADGIARIEQIPGTRRKHKPPRSGATNGFVNVHNGGSLSTSYNESGVETDESGGRRRSRVSFESIRGRDDDGMEGRQSLESDGGRVRNEAEEICRRLWESAEMVEGD